jgi:hypothetical protein
MLNEEEKPDERHTHNFGILIKKDGTTEPLQLREVINKIIHSREPLRRVRRLTVVA